MKNLIKILRLGEQNVSRGKFSDENTGRCMWEKGQGANRVRARSRGLSAEQGEGQRHTHTHTCFSRRGHAFLPRRLQLIFTAGPRWRVPPLTE